MKMLRVCALLTFVALSAPVGASSVKAEDAAESRAAAFQAVEGSRGEQVPGGPLMVSAYGVVMVLLLGYVARLALLQRKTAAEVERLSSAIQRARSQGK
jgi:hypothetical protein